MHTIDKKWKVVLSTSVMPYLANFESVVVGDE